MSNTEREALTILFALAFASAGVIFVRFAGGIQTETISRVKGLRGVPLIGKLASDWHTSPRYRQYVVVGGWVCIGVALLLLALLALEVTAA